MLFSSLCTGIPKCPEDFQDYQYASHILRTPDFAKHKDSIKIALITEGDDLKPYQSFRSALYKMQYNGGKNNIIDLGGYKGGNIGLAELIDHLSQQNILSIIVGSSPYIPYGILQAHSNNTSPIKMALVESTIDWGTVSNPSIFKKLVEKHPTYLSQLNCIGYQSYFTNPETLHFLKQAFFETNRLGVLQEQLTEVEPMLRTANCFGINLSAISATYAPANRQPNPNGFTAKEACQIMRYVGMSSLINNVGIYNFKAELDHLGLSAVLMAQMFWYIIEGFYQRLDEVPPKLEELTRYELQLSVGHFPISFFKSPKSERWWFYLFEQNKEVSADSVQAEYLIPCSYQDYLAACEGDLSPRIMYALESK